MYRLALILFAIVLFSCKKEETQTTNKIPINYGEGEFPEGGSIATLPPVLPHIYIETDDGQKIESKDNYVKADISIDGKGVYDDYSGKTKIRGRGNSTWTYPKKPYRLKLTDAAELLGLSPYKNWVLLAEYMEGSMLYNSIPFATGHLLGMPYTNHIIPVQITLNEEYQGVYAFTEHKEVGPNRIDIGSDGVLLEMDEFFDEAYKFKSDHYNLPIMVQYPKDGDMTLTKLDEIKADYMEFEDRLFDDNFPENDYKDYFDIYALINYIIVYELTFNQEINIPRSTYFHKKKGEKYNMGIIWDFDWGFGYWFHEEHFDISMVHYPAIGASKDGGATFFLRFFEDPVVCWMLAQRWEWFRNNKYEELREYVIAYAETVRHGYDADHQVWGLRGASGNLDADLQKTLTWLDARANFLDTYFKGLIH